MSAKMPVDLSQFSTKELQDWIDGFDVIFCDCDGVLWHHEYPVKTANETVNKLVSLKKRVYLVTNNSQLTRESMLDKCKRMEINLPIESLMTASYVTAHYLKQLGFDKKAYVCGPPALGKELTEIGVEHFGIGPDPLECSITDYCMGPLRHSKSEELPPVGAVIVGFDAQFSYKKLLKATNYLQDPEMIFLSTNADRTFAFPWFVLPEVVPIVSSIETAVNRKSTVIGKPSKVMFDVIKAESPPFDLDRTLIIGDTLFTDIIFSKKCGIKSLFVETGHSKMKDVEEMVKKNSENPSEEFSQQIPDFSIPHLGDIAKKLANKM